MARRRQGGCTDQHLAAVGCSTDARGLVHAGAGVIEADAVRLRLVDPDPHGWHEALCLPMCRQAALNGDCRFKCFVGIGEGQEKAIARCFHLLAALLGHGHAQQLVMDACDLVPRRVAHHLGQACGIDDVGEHEDAYRSGGCHAQRLRIRSGHQALQERIGLSEVQHGT